MTRLEVPVDGRVIVVAGRAVPMTYSYKARFCKIDMVGVVVNTTSWSAIYVELDSPLIVEDAARGIKLYINGMLVKIVWCPALARRSSCSPAS